MHSSVSDLKSVKALSSRGGAPFTGLGGTALLAPPLYTPLTLLVFLKVIFEVRSRAQKYLAAHGGHFE